MSDAPPDDRSNPGSSGDPAISAPPATPTSTTAPATTSAAGESAGGGAAEGGGEVRLAELEVPRGIDLDALVPPPRFADATLGSYIPQHPSQEAAERRVAEFVAGVRSARRGNGGLGDALRSLFGGANGDPGRGLYLDGGFGVGKTHLLAAAWHRAAERLGASELLYLSFQELVHIIGVLGRADATERLAGQRLICIDEFELDDPGNTLIVKTFLQAVFERGGTVVTTSNTPPEAQGRGRFNARDFEREIQSIAARFDTAEIGGPDYRHRDRVGELLSDAELARRRTTERPEGLTVTTDWRELRAFLEEHHPSRYRGALQPVGAIYLAGLERIEQQNDALRFVHFIDRVYDLKVGFRAAGTVPLAELYAPSYRDGAYAKKHYRSLSRLSEMLEEPVGDG